MSRILDFEDGFESETEASVIGVPASTVTVEPTGNLESTNSQDALVELQENIDDNKTETDAAIETVSDNLDAHVSATTTALSDLNTELDTHTGASSAHGVSGSVVGTTDTQTLSNKKIGDALSFAQVGTPSAPPASTNKLYPKANGKFYYMGPDGVEQPVGSGGGGSKNYLGLINGVDNNGNFELGNTNGWSKFSTTLNALKIPTGGITLTAASINTFAASASGKLAGSFSLWVTSTGAFAAGDGFISDPFTFDAQDLGKAFYSSFYYQLTGTGLVGAGNNTNTFAFYFYDVANAKWVQPHNVYGMSTLNAIGYVRGQFQPEINATSYRLAVICINASGGATDLHFDDFEVSPSKSVFGSSNTDWSTPVPLTVGAVTTAPTKGTVALDQISYRRNGPDMEISIDYRQTAGGSAGNGTYLYTLPGGVSFASTVNTSTTDNVDTNANLYGPIDVSNGQGNNSLVAWVKPYDATRFSLLFGPGMSDGGAGTSGTQNQMSSTSFSFSEVKLSIKGRFSVPILGWSSSNQMSDVADQRTNVFRGSRNATQAVTANVTNIAFQTTNRDSHGLWTGSSYVVISPGDFFVAGTFWDSASTNFQALTFINGVQHQNLFFGGGQPVSGSMLLPDLKAGDVISVRSNVSHTLSAGGHLSIFKISGSQTISATARMSCRYTNIAGTVVGTSPALFPFATKEYDSHGLFSAGVFTAQSPGEHEVIVALTGSTSGSVETVVYLYKNGSFYSRLADAGPHNGTSFMVGTDTVMLLAGETLSIYAFASTNNTMSTQAGANRLIIRWTGL